MFDLYMFGTLSLSKMWNPLCIYENEATTA